MRIKLAAFRKHHQRPHLRLLSSDAEAYDFVRLTDIR